MVQFMTISAVFYLTVAAYQILLNHATSWYYFVPNQKTDGSSLLYSAMFLSRLVVMLWFLLWYQIVYITPSLY